MYSVVLAAALCAGGGTSGIGWKHGHVPSSAGCLGYLNCYGPCYGSGYTGWGEGYGQWSPWGQGYSGHAGWGHGHGGPPAWGGTVGWDGGGGCGGYNSPAYGHPYTPIVSTPRAADAPVRTPPRATDKDREKVKEKEDDTAAVQADRARLTVELPAGAKLYVDDRAVRVRGERATFHTPQLAQGKAYFYEVKVELLRDGQTVSQTRRVVVRPGGASHVDFRATEGKQLSHRFADDKVTR